MREVPGFRLSGGERSSELHIPGCGGRHGKLSDRRPGRNRCPTGYGWLGASCCFSGLNTSLGSKASDFGRGFCKSPALLRNASHPEKYPWRLWNRHGFSRKQLCLDPLNNWVLVNRDWVLVNHDQLRSNRGPIHGQETKPVLRKINPVGWRLSRIQRSRLIARPSIHESNRCNSFFSGQLNRPLLKSGGRKHHAFV